MLALMFFLSVVNQSVEPSFYFLKETSFARSSETRAWFSGQPIAVSAFPQKIRIKVAEDLARHYGTYLWHHGFTDYDGSVHGNVDEETVEFFREFFSIKFEQKRIGPTQEEIDYLNGCASMLFFP